MILSPGILDIIVFENLANNSDDPLFYPYLIDIFETIRAFRSMEESDKVIRDFFDAQKIEKILEAEDFYNAGLLCEILPNDMFREFIPLLKKKLLKWKRNIPGSIINVMCDHAPEEVAAIFRSFPENGDEYWKIPHKLVSSVEKMPQELAAPLVTLYLGQTRGDMIREPSDNELKQIAYAWKLRIPERSGSFVSIFHRSRSGGEELSGKLKLFFNTLYGNGHAFTFLDAEFSGYLASSEVMELIDDFLTSNSPKKELSELLDCNDRKRFGKHIKNLIHRIENPTSQELLRELIPYVKETVEESYYSQVLITITTIVIQDYLKDTLNIKETSLEELLAYIFLEWHPLPHYQQIFEKIETFPRETVLKQVKDLMIESWGDNSRNLIALANDLGGTEWIPDLLEFVHEDEDEIVRQEAMNLLIKLGQPVIQAIDERWSSLDEWQKNLFSSIIAGIGGEDAIQFLIRIHDDDEIDIEKWACNTLKCPDVRFLDILEEKLEESGNNPGVEEAYHGIRVLFNQPSAISDALRIKHEKRRKENEEINIASAMSTLFYPEPNVITMKLKMRCQNCDRIDQYEITKLWANRENGAISPALGQDISCTACHTWNDFDFTERAFELIQSEVERALELDEDFLPNMSPVIFYPEMEGEVVNVGVVLKNCKKNLSKSPEDARLWGVYGYNCKLVAQYEKAKLCFKKCLQFDPYAIEATFSLAILNIKNGNFEEAFQLLDNQWPNAANWGFYETDDEEYFIQFIDDYMELYTGVCKELEREPRESLINPYKSPDSFHYKGKRKTARIGRNDPCPCGSGKKFKKCCMNR